MPQQSEGVFMERMRCARFGAFFDNIGEESEIKRFECGGENAIVGVKADDMDFADFLLLQELEQIAISFEY